jgi:hypothetical protein
MADQEEDQTGSPKREKQGRARGEARPKKLVHLDKEFGKEMMKTNADEDFKCWRCQVLYSSKSFYTWYTSQGEKIICNGCRGSLLQARPKPLKAGPKLEQPAADAEVAVESTVESAVESAKKKKRKEKESDKALLQEDDEEKPLVEVNKAKKKRIRSDAK